MSVRAAAQVAMDDLTDTLNKPTSVLDQSVRDAIDVLKDGLVDDRAREAGPGFYKLVVDLFESALDTKTLTKQQLLILSRLRALCHEVKNGSPE